MAKSKAKTFTVTDGKMVLVLEVAEEGGYVVTAPFVQGLITQGETVEEAFEMAYDAAACLRASPFVAAQRAARGRRAGNRTAPVAANR